MGPEQYRFIERTQVAIGLLLGLAGIALATLAPRFTQWLLPALGVLWATAALIIARRLATVGARSAFVRLTADLIGIASVVRIVYLVRHAA